MYVRIKKFLIQNRIFTYISEASTRLVNQVKSLPFKEVHLTEPFDKSFRDMEHPDLKSSPLWHLSKAIGKTNITPPELAKQFFTNPEAPKQMTLFTFDKKEL